MAVRTWANTLGVGAGAGLLAGAGQLGIGYGLGIVRWDRDFPTPGPWHAQLAWIAFLTVVAVVAGGYAGSWAARRNRLERTVHAHRGGRPRCDAHDEQYRGCRRRDRRQDQDL